MSSLGCVVVTGVNGFVGRHLVAELREAGAAVVGIGQEREPAVDGLGDYVSCDLTTRWPAVDADAVVHLAGPSAVGRSFVEPQRYLADTSAMMTHLGEHLARTRAATRLLVVSTGAVYGGGEGPYDEAHPTVPSSPYVVSKLLLEHQVGYYTRRGVDALVVRPFNHIGPGQGPGFLVPDLLAAARAAATTVSTGSGAAGPMLVGDLSTRRDYTDVRDVVRAYRLLLAAPDPGHRLFNVCSGRSWSGAELLELMRTGDALGDVEVAVDERRIRPDDPREVVGDASRLRRAVGWRPLVDVPTSIRDVLTATG